VLRRAPFADNPTVGARGQATQRRIVVSALGVFGDEGYHRANVDRIARRAGCSRVAFYQYFSSKEDVFRYLAGQVAREITGATDELEPVGPDASGWAALRAWIDRYCDIYGRYEPVFVSFDVAAETDGAVAGGGARIAARYIAGIRSRLTAPDLASRRRDPVITVLVECLTRACYLVQLLRAARPTAYPRDALVDAFTDVMHRTLFGLRAGVNVHPPARTRPPTVPFDAGLRGLFAGVDPSPPPGSAAHGTLTALIEAGRDAFARRGYHATRVDDIVAGAGLSHGAFYRYFDNKAACARVLAAGAMTRLGANLTDLPRPGGDGSHETAALRRWLRRYNAAQASEVTMLRTWIDATIQDPSLGVDSAPVVDWGRRRFAHYLEPRDFGDVEMDALLMVALIDAYGATPRPAAMTDAAAVIIQQGMFGRSRRSGTRDRVIVSRAGPPGRSVAGPR